MEALPFVSTLAKSYSARDRGIFVRLYADFVRYLAQRELPVPGEWRRAFDICLSNSDFEERDMHVFALSDFDLVDNISSYRRNRGNNWSENPAENSIKAIFVENTHTPLQVDDEKISEKLECGDLESLIVLASNQEIRLRLVHIAALVDRARIAADGGDARLANAVLARRPVRMEVAPLFLEANSEQRMAIVLAAQRAELGKLYKAAIATVARDAIAKLEHAAIDGDTLAFIELFGRTIGAPSDLTERIAMDPTGEPLAIALVAIGATNDVCVRILTATDMHERGEFRRIHTLARLSGALNPRAARRIVSAIIATPGLKPTVAPSPAPLARQNSRWAGRVETNARHTGATQPRKANTVGAK